VPPLFDSTLFEKGIDISGHHTTFGKYTGLNYSSKAIDAFSSLL
jgi:hypothetical protein